MRSIISILISVSLSLTIIYFFKAEGREQPINVDLIAEELPTTSDDHDLANIRSQIQTLYSHVLDLRVHELTADVELSDEQIMLLFHQYEPIIRRAYKFDPELAATRKWIKDLRKGNN